MADKQLPELPQREEDQFDFSVLFRDDEPTDFTIPHIIEMVFLFIILLVVIFHK